jgi:biopolymer transport protein ExbD
MPEPTEKKVRRRPRRRVHHKIHTHRPAVVRNAAVRSEINVTPLVDVVLVLLIIFMVVTPMLNRGVKVELPITAHHNKKQDAGELLVVTVRADGTYIETDRLSGELLDLRLRQELKVASRPVHVRADRSLRYGDVRKVLEQVHAAGATAVALATDEKKD